MDISIIINILILATIILLLVFVYKIANRYLDIKNKQVENDKMNIFMQMDPKIAQDEVDKYIDNIIAEYALVNIIIEQIQYIGKEQQDDMVKIVTQIALLRLPELYLFYIKIFSNIDSEATLIETIRRLVKARVLEYVLKFNSNDEE